jgi:hypothetical protein
MFGTLRGLNAMQDRRELEEGRRIQNEARRRLLEDDYAVRESLQRTGDPDQAIGELWKAGRMGAASTLAKHVFAQRDEQAKALQAKVEADGARLKQSAQILQAVNDEPSFQMARRAVTQLWGEQGGEIAGYLGDKYDADRVKQVVAYGSTRGEHMTSQQNALKNFFDWEKHYLDGLKGGLDNEKIENDIRAKQVEGASNMLATATSQEEWDAFQRMLKAGGYRTEVLGLFGNAYSPAAVARAKKLGLDGAQEASIVNQQNQTSMSLERLANENERLDLAHQREGRIAAGGGVTGAGGRGSTLTANARDASAAKKLSNWTEFEADLRTRYSRRPDGSLGRRDKSDLTESDRHTIASEKLRIEDSHREGAGMGPLLDTERALMRDPAKKSDLANVRRKIRALTGMDKTPIEQALDLARQIQKEQDPQTREALQVKQRALLQAYGLTLQ